MAREKLYKNVDQIFVVTRIMLLCLSRNLSSITGEISFSKFIILNSLFSTDTVYSTIARSITDQECALICASISSIIETAPFFPLLIRTDLEACIFHIFARIMGTPACHLTLVQSLFPILKKFCISIRSNPPLLLVKQIRSSIKICLNVLKISQRREYEEALQCEKNMLMTITLFLTTFDHVLRLYDNIVDKVVAEVVDCLNHELTSNVAAGCCRLLLAPNSAKSATDAIRYLLLPPILEIMLAEAISEPSKRSCEVLEQSLISFAATSRKPRRLASYLLLTSYLMAKARLQGPNSYADIAARLINLAAQGSEEMRAILSTLGKSEKSFLETLIVHGKAHSGAATETSFGELEPAISLKMDFGDYS